MVDADALEIPLVEAVDALVNLDGVVPAQTMELGDVGELLERAVGLGRVPAELAPEAYLLHDALGDFLDGDFLARADVDVAVADFPDAVTVDGEVALLDDVLEIDVEQAMDGGVCHLLAPEKLAHGGSRAPQGDGLGRDAVVAENLQDGLLVAHGGRHDGLRSLRLSVVLGALSVYHLRNLHGDGSQPEVFPDGFPVALVEALGKMNLANHGGKHVGVLEVEVVVGTIEVGRHDSDVVGAVLEIEALAHLESGNLGDGVWLVGVLKRRGQQAILGHGLRSLAGIDAGGAEEEKFLYAMLPCLADDVLLNLQVLVDEIGAILEVGHDAAHMGCRQHDGIGLFVVEELFHGYGVEQVELCMGLAHKVLIAAGLEVVADGGAHQSVVPCHKYLAVLV